MKRKLEGAFGGRDGVAHALVQSYRHPQGAAKSLENGLGDMMGIDAFQVVDMQSHPGVVDESLEKLVKQIDVKRTDHAARKKNVITQTRTAGKIHHDPRQSFIQRHIGMAVTDYAFLVADGPGESLAQGNANVFDGMVRVDMQIAVSGNVHVDQAVPGYLVEHVVQERYAGGETGFTGAVQVDGDFDLGFKRVAFDLGGAWGHFCKFKKNIH